MLPASTAPRHNSLLVARVCRTLTHYPGHAPDAADFAQSVEPRPLTWSDVAFCQLITVDSRKALLIVREKALTEHRECTHCSARLDPDRHAAFTGDVLSKDGATVPLDGTFCCEDCTIEAAQATPILPAPAGRGA